MSEEKEKSFLDCIKPINDKLLCEKVRYGEGDDMDPDDTSNLWFKVLAPKEEKNKYSGVVVYGTGNNEPFGFWPKYKKIEEGFLVSANIRHCAERKIEGRIYYIVSTAQIDLIIHKNDVKESLFR